MPPWSIHTDVHGSVREHSDSRNRSIPEIAYNADGPAVILGESTSLFPRQLAVEWRSRGHDVVLVTRNRGEGAELPMDAPIVRAHHFERARTRWLRRGLRPLLSPCERFAAWWGQGTYRRRTGRENMEQWEWPFVNHFWDSFSVARAALSLRPRFVFGQEVGAYGLATALCRGVPRILFPWGGDIFWCAETSIFFRRMVTYSLARCDLVVPASLTAARHVVDRFGIPAERVRAQSWGVDLSLFQRASDADRVEFFREHRIPADSVLLLSVRKFIPRYHPFEVLQAFLQIAREQRHTHFLILTGGGIGAETHVERAKSIVAQAGVEDRFTFLDGQIPLTECARAMSVSDIFVSLFGLGDMRSASILQAAAAGGVPVIADVPEFREIARLGFAAEFVSPSNLGQVTDAIRHFVVDASLRRSVAERNAEYMRRYEETGICMQQLLDAIDEVCSRYGRGDG